MKSRDVPSATSSDPVLKCVTCQVQHSSSVLSRPFKDQVEEGSVRSWHWPSSPEFFAHDSICQAMTHLGLLAVAHLALIWSTMSQPKIFGLVSLFCMKSWFFIFIMKTLHIVLMNLTWIIQISVEGGLPRQSEKWFGRFRAYEPSRPSRFPELRWVMESFGNRITHRKFHSRERRLEQQVWLSQHLALALHHKRVLGSRRRYCQDKEDWQQVWFPLSLRLW